MSAVAGQRDALAALLLDRTQAMPGCLSHVHRNGIPAMPTRCGLGRGLGHSGEPQGVAGAAGRAGGHRQGAPLIPASATGSRRCQSAATDLPRRSRRARVRTPMRRWSGLCFASSCSWAQGRSPGGPMGRRTRRRTRWPRCRSRPGFGSSSWPASRTSRVRSRSTSTRTDACSSSRCPAIRSTRRPTGRVKLLEDTDGDGRYETSDACSPRAWCCRPA